MPGFKQKNKPLEVGCFALASFSSQICRVEHIDGEDVFVVELGAKESGELVALNDGDWISCKRSNLSSLGKVV